LLREGSLAEHDHISKQSTARYKLAESFGEIVMVIYLSESEEGNDEYSLKVSTADHNLKGERTLLFLESMLILHLRPPLGVFFA
jgi:hypothetical protein